MPGPVAGDSSGVVQAGRPEDLWNNYPKPQKCKSWMSSVKLKRCQIKGLGFRV